MPISGHSTGNAFNHHVLGEEGSVSEAFDTHAGTSVMAFGKATGPVVLQASQDGEHWFNVARAELDAEGHFAFMLGDFTARYARLKAWRGEGTGEQHVTATITGKANF